MDQLRRNEFRDVIIQKLLDVYGYKFSMNQRIFDVWYEHVGGVYDLETIKKAVDQYVNSSTFPPVIADIRRLCDDAGKEELKTREYVNNNWLAILDARPTGEGTETAHKYFLQYVYQYKDPLAMAHRVWEWVKDYEGDLTLEGMMERLCRK